MKNMQDFMPDTWKQCYGKYIMNVFNTLVDNQLSSMLVSLRDEL